MIRKIFPAILAAALVLGGCNTTKPDASSTSIPESVPPVSSAAPVSSADQGAITLLQFMDPAIDSEIATISTSMGDIKVMFFPQQAPKTVENFITHAKNGYYDGIKFHRVIPEFMIQGGDPLGTGTGGESIWGGSFEDEISSNLYNFRGALSMANTGRPSSNGSQFFIVNTTTLPEKFIADMRTAGIDEQVVKKYEELGGTPWLDGKHTVFGYVLEGMDVVDSIANSPANQDDAPLEDITIKSIAFEKVAPKQ